MEVANEFLFYVDLILVLQEKNLTGIAEHLWIRAAVGDRF
jgi:hypothetical protein